METGIIGSVVGAAAAWVWANYGKDVTDTVIKKIGVQANEKALNSAKAAWLTFDWKKASNTYREEMYKQYSTTRVLGKPDPITLEDIFTDVYILDEPSAFKRFDITTLQTDPNKIPDDDNRINGLRLVKKPNSNRLFILGKPGAGKTTFLKYITLQATKGYLDKIPIFVSLKSWADSGFNLMSFLDQQFEICNFPDARHFINYILEKGYAIVLFDGLDEVTQEEQQRDRTIAAMRDFCHQHRKTQVLITCRIAATDYTFQEFRYVELADFTEKQVEIYAKHWFRDTPEKLKKFYLELNKDENKGLRDLARIPLLLGLLCLSFDSTMSFPQRRVEIYEEALEALLKKWDSSRSIKRDEIYQGLSLGRKRQMLSRIASRTFQDNQYFAAKDLLAKYVVDYLKQLPNAPLAIDIDGEAIVEAIEAQHGIFTERAKRIYSFSHLTFQEYFTAKHVVENVSGQAIRDLLSVRNIADSRWREVIIMVASLLDDADLFFQLFMKSLSSLIKDSAIQSILLWANGKATNVLLEAKQRSFPLNVPSSIVRFIYLYLELTLTTFSSDRFLYTKVDIIGLADSLIRSQQHRQSLKQVLDIPSAAELIQERNLNRAVTNFCTRSLDRASYISQHFGSDIATDWYLYNQLFLVKFLLTSEIKDSSKFTSVFKSNLNEVKKGTKNNPLHVPFSLLEALKNQQTWKEIMDALIVGMNTNRNIGYFRTLHNDTFRNLSDYILASRLMNDCLRMAVVTERQAIVDSYCLPSHMWQFWPTLLK